MESESPGPVAKPRGRRPAAQAGDARATIVAAAAKEFARRGYDAASLRSIAKHAGVDPALVHHYFDDKADLFTASISAPIRPDRLVREILDGPHDRIGENLVRALVTNFELPGTRDRMISLLRTALGEEFAATMLRQFLVREVFRRVAEAIGGADPELRASLAASQIVGLIMVRYGIRIEPLASAPIEVVVASIGPIVQWHLGGSPLALGRGASAPLDSGDAPDE
jgi:AcrR family transcriptional regulator